jgi:hypothetical protein
MSRKVKFLIGLAAVMLLGWLYHGPLGNGERLVGQLEAQARTAVAGAEVPGVTVTLPRDPLARTAILSGPANDLQRNGMGSQKGLNGMVAEVEGISGVRWSDDGDGARVIPLLLETLATLLLAYLVGLALAWLLFGRKKRESYL